MGIKLILVKLSIGGLIASFGIFGNFNDMISLTLTILGYLIIGGDVLLSAVKNILRGNALDENFLMSIATIGAFFINERFEAVAVMVFYQVGEAFQRYAVGKSRNSISELMDIRPEYANVKRNGEIITLEPTEVLVDDIIVIKPGEKIPLDGVVLEGASSIDTRALTGESMPTDVEVGNNILSGCININGLLTAKVTRKYTDSTVAKILELVENASARKSKSEKFITKFARYYTPVVVIAALLLSVIPPLLGIGEFSDWIYRGLSFLVISCPCALVISIPLGFFGGIGGAAKKGILMKGSSYIEALSKADVVIFDKTGTLTKGEFIIKEIVPFSNTLKDELLRIAAIAESASNHPIAVSIVKAYGNNFSHELKNVEEIAGYGVKVSYNGTEIYVGNDKLMKKINIKYQETSASGSVAHVVKDNVYIGYILVADQVKKDSTVAIKELKKIGIEKIVMLTGDKEVSAQAIGKEVGIDFVYSELLPGDKVTIAEEEINKVRDKRTLAYVGDGINDAPVLARADIGIAMGGVGSQAAIEAADVVVMTDEPSKIVTAIEISKKTLTIVKQNIALSFIIKGGVLILATLGLSTLMQAIFADVGVACLAILNAMRAMNFKERKL